MKMYITLLILSAYAPVGSSPEAKADVYKVVTMPNFLKKTTTYGVLDSKLVGIKHPGQLVTILNLYCPQNANEEEGEIVIFNMTKKIAISFIILPQKTNYIRHRTIRTDRKPNRSSINMGTMGISKVMLRRSIFNYSYDLLIPPSDQLTRASLEIAIYACYRSRAIKEKAEYPFFSNRATLTSSFLNHSPNQLSAMKAYPIYLSGNQGWNRVKRLVQPCVGAVAEDNRQGIKGNDEYAAHEQSLTITISPSSHLPISQAADYKPGTTLAEFSTNQVTSGLESSALLLMIGNATILKQPIGTANSWVSYALANRENTIQLSLVDSLRLELNRLKASDLLVVFFTGHGGLYRETRENLDVPKWTLSNTGNCQYTINDQAWSYASETGMPIDQRVVENYIQLNSKQAETSVSYFLKSLASCLEDNSTSSSGKNEVVAVRYNRIADLKRLYSSALQILHKSRNYRKQDRPTYFPIQVINLNHCVQKANQLIVPNSGTDILLGDQCQSGRYSLPVAKARLEKLIDGVMTSGESICSFKDDLSAPSRYVVNKAGKFTYPLVGQVDTACTTGVQFLRNISILGNSIDNWDTNGSQARRLFYFGLGENYKELTSDNIDEIRGNLPIPYANKHPFQEIKSKNQLVHCEDLCLPIFPFDFK